MKKVFQAFALLVLVIVTAGWLGPSQIPTPSGTNTVPQWNGSALSWVTSGSGLGSPAAHSVLVGEGASAPAAIGPGSSGVPLLGAGGSADPAFGAINLAGGSGIVTGTLPVANVGGPSGSGLLHSTSAALDSASYVGTAGQALFTNSGATDSAWGSFSNDFTCSTSTPGLCTIAQISGSSPLNVTPATVQWLKGTASPTLTEAIPTSDVAPNTLTVQAQSCQATASTNTTGADLLLQPGQGATSNATFRSGNVVANVFAPSAAGTESFFTVKRAGTPTAFIGGLVGNPTTNGALYLGNITPTATNYVVQTNGTAVNFNTPSGAWSATVGGTVAFSTTTSTLSVAAALGGSGTTSFHWANTASAIACGTGGTQTISSAQALTPGLSVTTGTLSSNCILDFGTNGVTGFWVIDMSGATPGATFGIQFKNGSATSTVLSGGVATGSNLALVFTHGANTLAVQY